MIAIIDRTILNLIIFADFEWFESFSREMVINLLTHIQKEGIVVFGFLCIAAPLRKFIFLDGSWFGVQ